MTSFLSPLLPNKIATSLWRIFFKRKCIGRRVIPTAVAGLDKGTSRDQVSTKTFHRVEYLPYHWKGFDSSATNFFRRKRTTSHYPHHRRLDKGMSRDQVLRDNYTTSHYPHYYWIRQRHVTWRARYAPSLFPLKAIPFHSRTRILSFYKVEARRVFFFFCGNSKRDWTTFTDREANWSNSCSFITYQIRVLDNYNDVACLETRFFVRRELINRGTWLVVDGDRK